MANTLHAAGADSLALQVTTEARSAGLVEEDSDGDATYRAEVIVYAFDDLVIAFDRDTDRVPMADRAEIVDHAVRSTESIHRAHHASIQHSGNGYRVQVLVATDAGFSPGQELPCHAAPGMLLMAPYRTDAPKRELLDLRKTQTSEVGADR